MKKELKVKKVLIIEDNEDNLYMMKFILLQNNIESLEARTGIDGYGIAIKEKPDLILMDIQLPDVNGIEITKMIRASDLGNKIPIIAISSYAMLSDKKKAIEAGCNEYISKPIEPENIMNIINKFL